MDQQFDNLPPLTNEQAAVVGAMLSPHACIHDAACAIDMAIGRFFDLLASPEVQTHLKHIRRSLDQRLNLRLADAAHKAVDCLERIAESMAPHGNPQVAPLQGESLSWQSERRRAATTILRAHTAPRTRTRRSSPRRIDVNRVNALIARIEQAEPEIPPDEHETPATPDEPPRGPPRRNLQDPHESRPRDRRDGDDLHPP